MSVGKWSGGVGLASRGGIAAALGVLAAFAGGCTVGSGSGAASGPIYVLGCFPNGGDYSVTVDGGSAGPLAVPRFFDLQPTFFAGEPTEHIGDVVSQPANLLTIRMQRNGNRIEINDTLYFDILNSYEVARCVRGRTVNGVPDWDTRMTTNVHGEVMTSTPWCDWSGNAEIGDGGASDGGDAGAGVDAGNGGIGGDHAVIHLTTEDMVHSSLSLLFTCHQADLTAVAVDGTLEFQDFGSAAQPDVPSEMREMVPSNFKINFGDRLRARFRVVLQDQRIWGAIKQMLPMPAPSIGGELSGYFDFDLERGRAAQPFP
jgi:hypothetical protein